MIIIVDKKKERASFISLPLYIPLATHIIYIYTYTLSRATRILQDLTARRTESILRTEGLDSEPLCVRNLNRASAAKSLSLSLGRLFAAAAAERSARDSQLGANVFILRRAAAAAAV